jgi:hypothetical protein
MVKKGSTFPRPPVNKDGRPRRKPGKPANPDDVRTERLSMRVHPDLAAILTARARERGITRSQYIEQLLVGWVKIDPRNPKIDAIGRIDVDAAPPLSMRLEPLKFGERWARLATVMEALLGMRPADEWIEDEHGYFEWAKRAAPEDTNEEGEVTLPPRFIKR